MSDRGEYRAVRRVLLDGPDFQRLPERARWVFLALKLNFGPAGLEVWYPAELAARLSAQTGATTGAVTDALDRLESAGWIRREGNVVWIDGQLNNDPHVKVADGKHRKMIQRHIAGLPRLAIVADFVKAHEEWFTVDGWTYEGPSKGHRSTKDKPENEPENESLGSSDDDPGEIRPSGYSADFEALWAEYPKRAGGNSKKEAYHAWNARLRAGIPREPILAGTRRYKAFCVAEGKIGTRYVMQASTFLGPGDHCLEPWEPDQTVLLSTRATVAGPDDDVIWSALQDVVAKLARNQLTADEYRALPKPMQAGLRAVGGWAALREVRQSDMPFRRRDFLAAYHAAERVTAGAA